jgi:hypothetical protein
LFYRRLHSVVDDYGRAEADPKLLRSDCYPLRTDQITEEQVASWLADCTRILEGEDEPLVIVYTVGRKRYLQITNFKQPTRTPSKFPAPPDESAEPGTTPGSTPDPSLQGPEIICNHLLPRARAPRASQTQSHTHSHSHSEEGGAGGNQSSLFVETQQLVQDSFPGTGETLIAEIVTSATAIRPGLTAHELSAALIRTHKGRHQRSAALWLHTLPAFLRSQTRAAPQTAPTPAESHQCWKCCDQGEIITGSSKPGVLFERKPCPDCAAPKIPPAHASPPARLEACHA